MRFLNSMKNIIKSLFAIFAVAFLFMLTSGNVAYAYQTSLPSANLAGTQVNSVPVLNQDDRAQVLRSYLEQYNSPLADHADTIIQEADANNIDWRWIVAISGVESGFGEAIPAYSYNAWGYNIYGNNTRSFDSWDDGITTVSTALRETYMNGRGETNIYAIGSSYAADPDWAYKVQGYVDDIDQYSQRFDKPNLSISL
jgi:mannosyl-glycoprotein endo-beta-N-acetylglucosaminidase